MAVLVIGPTGVGKSTFILKSSKPKRLGIKKHDIVFGFQLPHRDVPAKSLIHYDLTNPVVQYGGDLRRANAEWNFRTEFVFQKLIESGLLEQCIVLVAPLSELVERIESRKFDEDHGPGYPYDSKYRSNLVKNLDLFKIYEILFETLDELRVPYRVLFSSKQKFSASDRAFVHANLKGLYIVPPSWDDVERVVAATPCEYQSPLLPHGFTTKMTTTSGFEHLGAGRHLTFERILAGSLIGNSVLDVGCAIGDLLFTAERLGAQRLVGIERNPGRLAAAIAIGKLLRSEAEFYSGDFLDIELHEQFDQVFVLNVIHHVQDFERFLRKAAAIAKHRLTLEFPTLTDEYFRDLHGLVREDIAYLNELPLIGQSSHSVNQTFVYSPVAMRNLLMNEIGGFSTYKILNSPISDRVIMSFER